jgi:hypothetical protein
MNPRSSTRGVDNLFQILVLLVEDRVAGALAPSLDPLHPAPACLIAGARRAWRRTGVGPGLPVRSPGPALCRAAATSASPARSAPPAAPRSASGPAAGIVSECAQVVGDAVHGFDVFARDLEVPLAGVDLPGGRHVRRPLVRLRTGVCGGYAALLSGRSGRQIWQGAVSGCWRAALAWSVVAGRETSHTARPGPHWATGEMRRVG